MSLHMLSDVPTRQALDPASYDRQWAQLDDYARFHPGARHRRRLLLAALRGIAFRNALDVGCGPGEGLLALQRAFPTARLCGADFASETIAANRSRMPGIRFELLDVAKASLAEQFELVVCSEVLEHLQDRAVAFRHLAQMVAPGGHLLVTCPTGKLFPTEAHFGHVSHPTAGELRACARDNGLRVQSLIEWGFPTYRVLKEATNLNPNWSLRNFAAGRYSAWKRALCLGLYLACFIDLPVAGAGSQLVVLMRKPPLPHPRPAA